MELVWNTETIRTAASVISACGIVIAVLQFWAQGKTRREHHERARREKAIEAIRHYDASATPGWSATRKLVERLTSEQLRAMDEGREFTIDGQQEQLASAALPDQEVKAVDGKITLTRELSYQLRHQALAMLNAAEIVFQSWARGVADSKIIAAQMKHLRNKETHSQKFVMENYLKLPEMQENYPALYHFMTTGKPDPL